jgi:uronate dehydrogenase
MTKAALTGAIGNIGRLLRPELLKRGVLLRFVGGTQPLSSLSLAEEVCHGDLRDCGVVDRALERVDVLIHMAGTSIERPLPEIIENNLRALHDVFEGARHQRVGRVVFASSNHAFDMYSMRDCLELNHAFRPDGFYRLSKAWGEAMARMYRDKHGIEVICLRIERTLEAPTEFRHLSTRLGHDDLLQLITCCIMAPDIGYVVVWAVSNNTRSCWSDAGAERLGYRPVQDAEDYAEQILKQKNPLDPIAQQYQCGSFGRVNITPMDQPALPRSAADMIEFDIPNRRLILSSERGRAGAAACGMEIACAMVTAPRSRSTSPRQTRAATSINSRTVRRSPILKFTR